MSAPLEDLRVRVNPRTRLVLDSIAETTGRTVSEVARDVIEEWAELRIEIADGILTALNEPPQQGTERKKPRRIPLTRAERDLVRSTGGGICSYCQSVVGKDEGHIDHVIPVSMGGTNDPTNLVLSCAACNLQKAGRTRDQWKGVVHG